MRAAEVVLFVKRCVVGGGVRGGPIRFERGVGGGREGATDDLFDAAGVEVDAGAEARHGGFMGGRSVEGGGVRGEIEV